MMDEVDWQAKKRGMSDDQFSKSSELVGDLRRWIDRQGEKIDDNTEWLGRVEQRLDGVEQRLDGVERRLDGVEQRLGDVEHRQADADRWSDQLEATLAKFFRRTEQRFDEIEARLDTKAEADRVYTTLDAILEKLDQGETERLATVKAVDLHDAWIKKASKVLDIKYERAA